MLRWITRAGGPPWPAGGFRRTVAAVITQLQRQAAAGSRNAPITANKIGQIKAHTRNNVPLSLRESVVARSPSSQVLAQSRSLFNGSWLTKVGGSSMDQASILNSRLLLNAFRNFPALQACQSRLGLKVFGGTQMLVMNLTLLGLMTASKESLQCEPALSMDGTREQSLGIATASSEVAAEMYKSDAEFLKRVLYDGCQAVVHRPGLLFPASCLDHSDCYRASSTKAAGKRNANSATTAHRRHQQRRVGPDFIAQSRLYRELYHRAETEREGLQTDLDDLRELLADKDRELLLLSDRLEAVTDRSLCVVCMNYRRSVVYGCGHLVVCQQCDAGLRRRAASDHPSAPPCHQCPICRREVTESIVCY
eukprot:Clim_evm6s210 gene=Clim_evmTU6s210